MKECPKCKTPHEKSGIYCSRACANSRIWNEEDKLKKSESARKSEKVKAANSNENKKKILSELATKQNKEGKTNFKTLHTDEVIKKVRVAQQKNKELRKSRLDKSNKKDYWKLCSFDFSLKDFPEEFDFDLIRKHGWYKAKNKGNNITGVSRDHKFSISEGYKQGIPPEIISHPANCQLLQHNDNFEKKGKCSITLIELYEEIEKWNKKYGPLT